MTQRTKINIYMAAVILFILLVLLTGCAGNSMIGKPNYTYVLRCNVDKPVIMSEILNKSMEIGATPMLINDTLGIIKLSHDVYIPIKGQRTYYYTFIINNNQITYSGYTSSVSRPYQTIADTPENRENDYNKAFFIFKDYLERFVCKRRSLENTTIYGRS